MTKVETRTVYLHTHSGKPQIKFSRFGILNSTHYDKPFEPVDITRASWNRINRCIMKCDRVTAGNSENSIWVGFWFE